MFHLSAPEVPFVAFPAVPTFFRACCWEASSGGLLSYSHPGHELARHVEGLVPYECEDDKWLDECEKLYAAYDADDRAAIERWFVQHYPRCMALVPRRRRSAFVDGVISMLDETRG